MRKRRITGSQSVSAVSYTHLDVYKRQQLAVENRERYDYRSFLKKFCVLKEEMQVDIDSFDYIFYHYGMEMYGNMPLIEPQAVSYTHLDVYKRQRENCANIRLRYYKET